MIMSNSEQVNVRLTHELTAFNYAENFANRIHSEEFAKEFGFVAGLVPGIGVFAYMTYPLVKRFGRPWLNCSTIAAKFIRPVYDGDRVVVEALEKEPGSEPFDISVKNAEDMLCAVGSAGMQSSNHAAPRMSDYPHRPLPHPNERMPARSSEFASRTLLGSVDFRLDPEEAETKARHEYLDDLEVYSGQGAVYHPAFLLEMANQIFKDNIALGPWIHTKSDMQNFASPMVGEPLSIRGHVTRAFEKGGHELIEADLAIFNRENIGVTRIRHTAIIHLGSSKG